MAPQELALLEAVIPDLRATSKKNALAALAAEAAKQTGFSEREITDVILEREKLGSTGVGHGVAIPHGKLPSLEGLHGVFARVTQPIDFESVDDQPVDLIFLLLAPENAGADHLKALAKISRMLRDKETCEKIRKAEGEDAIRALLAPQETSSAA